MSALSSETTTTTMTMDLPPPTMDDDTIMMMEEDSNNAFSCDGKGDGVHTFLSEPPQEATATDEYDENEVIRLCNAGVSLLEQHERRSEAADAFLLALWRVESKVNSNSSGSSSNSNSDPEASLTQARHHVAHVASSSSSSSAAASLPSSAEERADPSSYIYQREDYDEGLHVFGQALSISTAEHRRQQQQQVMLRYNVGQVYIRFRQYHQARRWFQTAWLLLLAQPAVNDATTTTTTTTTTTAWMQHLSVRIQHNLGFCSYCLGQNETALQWYQDALVLIDQTAVAATGNHEEQQQRQVQLDRAATYNCIAVLLFHRSCAKNNDTGEALKLLQAALSTYQSQSQSDVHVVKQQDNDSDNDDDDNNNNNNNEYSRSVATILGNMGRIYFLTSDHDRALRSFRKAYHIRQQVLGRESMDTAAMLFNLGQSLHYRGVLEQAWEAYGEFLRVARRHYGSSHQRDVCAVLRAMAQVQRQRGGKHALSEACALLREAFDAGCGALGAHAKEVNCILSELGSLYAERNEFDKSIDCFQQFLKLQEDIFGATAPLHTNIIITKINLARVYKHSSDYVLAFRYYKEVHAMQVQLSTCGPCSLEVASTLSSMGLMLYLMHAFQPSLDCYQEALRIRLDKLETSHHPDVAENINSVGLVLYKLGLMDMAKEAFQECIHLRTKLNRKDTTANTTATSTTDEQSSCTVAESREIAVLLFNMATACTQNGEDDQGIEWYNESLRVERKVLGEDHPDVGVTLKHIARVHQDRGDFVAAIDLLQQALRIAATGQTGSSEKTQDCNKSMVEILRTIGNLHYMLAQVPEMMACFAEAERTVGSGQGNSTVEHSNSLAGNLYGLSKLHPPASATA